MTAASDGMTAEQLIGYEIVVSAWSWCVANWWYASRPASRTAPCRFAPAWPSRIISRVSGSSRGGHARAGGLPRPIPASPSRGPDSVRAPDIAYVSREQVVVYRANGTVSVLAAGDTLGGEEILPGFAFPLQELFALD